MSARSHFHSEEIRREVPVASFYCIILTIVGFCSIAIEAGKDSEHGRGGDCAYHLDYLHNGGANKCYDDRGRLKMCLLLRILVAASHRPKIYPSSVKKKSYRSLRRQVFLLLGRSGTRVRTG